LEATGALSNTKISVLAIVSKSQQEKITAAVKQATGKLQVQYTKTGELESLLKKGLPDFLVFEYAEDLGTRIDQLTQKHPSVDIVVLLPKQNLDKANQILLAGARAFVPVPFENDEFIDSFLRLEELETRSHPKEAGDQPVNDRSRTLAVFSPRGGVGCTTIAVNTALAIHKATNKRTLLVDGKVSFGHVDLMLNMKGETSITDLLPHIENLDPRLIDSVVLQHASGLYTMLGPQTIEDGQSLQADHIFQIANAIKKEFDDILIDCGTQLDEKTVTWMDVSQKVLLVLTPTLADLRDIRRFLAFIHSLNIHAEKFMLILNKVGLKGALSVEEIESALGIRVFASLPQDEARAVRAMNRGVPVYFDDPRSSLGKAFTNLGNRLDKYLVAEAVPDHATKRGRRDLMSVTSRLG
jgi:pilus assembly protein CpaE